MQIAAPIVVAALGLLAQNLNAAAWSIMTGRRELGSIASGLDGSFNRRNNDVGGSWGIGKLYKQCG